MKHVEAIAALKRHMPPDDGCLCDDQPATTFIKMVNGRLEATHTVFDPCKRRCTAAG